MFPVVELSDENVYEKSDYLVQEPVTTPSSDKNTIEELKKESFAEKVAELRKGKFLIYV